MSKKYLKIELREIHLRIFPNEMCQRAREEKMLTMALGNSLDQKSVKQAYSAIHLPRVFQQYTGKLYYNNALIPLEIFRRNYPSADSWRVKHCSARYINKTSKLRANEIVFIESLMFQCKRTHRKKGKKKIKERTQRRSS